jgi:hypothetical protein
MARFEALVLLPSPGMALVNTITWGGRSALEKVMFVRSER